MDDEVIGIQITNKGAIVGIQMYCNMLILLVNIKQNGKDIKTIDDIKNDCLEQINKMLSWLDRKGDKSITSKEKQEAKKIARETIGFLQTTWNR